VRVLLLLAFVGLVLAEPEKPKPPTVPLSKEALIEESGVLEEIASSERGRKAADKAAKESAEETVQQLGTVEKLKNGDKKPLNPFYMGVGTEDLATGITTGFLGAMAAHSKDYEAIGPHLFPNVMIPDIVRLGTNAAGLDQGECYGRIVDMGKWCIKILYKKIGPFRVPYAVRFTPSVRYAFPVSKVEAGRDPYVSRYIPKILMKMNYQAVVNQPYSAHVSNEILLQSKAFSNFLKVNTYGLPKDLKTPDLGEIEKATKKAEEAYKNIPEHLRSSGQRNLGSSESVFLPEVTSRFLVDVINEQIPNKTFAITISFLDFVNPFALLSGLATLGNILQTMQNSQQFIQLMNDLKKGFFYGSALSKQDFEALFNSAMDKQSKKGIFSGNLDLNQLGKELGVNMDQINQLVNDVGSGISSGLGSTVSIVSVKMLCHKVKRPRNLKEWKVFEDHYVSYFLRGDKKAPQGFFHLSRFQRVFLPLHPELSTLLADISTFEKDPLMCSKLKYDKGNLLIKTSAYQPQEAEKRMCGGNMFLGYTHPFADAPTDPQMSMRGAHTGFYLASLYRKDMAYKFDKDKDKFSWMSPDPDLPKTCGPLFQDYKWSGSQNPDGDANMELPKDFPNVAIQWRNFHCCVDPGSRPMGWGEIKE
jgi:hypothetical protein